MTKKSESRALEPAPQDMAKVAAEMVEQGVRHAIEEWGAVIESHAVAIAEQSNALLEEAEDLGPIRTDEDESSQSEVQVRAKALRKQAEEDRKRITGPLDAVKTQLIARFRDASEGASKAEDLLTPKLRRYYVEKQERARKEQERQDRLARQRQERAEAKAEERGQEPPPPVIPRSTVAPPPKTIHTAAGRSTRREFWTCGFASDAAGAVKAAVAAGRLDLLLPNESAARALVRAGVREIPGYEVYQDVSL